jgi:hypothetical protein
VNLGSHKPKAEVKSANGWTEGSLEVSGVKAAGRRGRKCDGEAEKIVKSCIKGFRADRKGSEMRKGLIEWAKWKGFRREDNSARSGAASSF